MPSAHEHRAETTHGGVQPALDGSAREIITGDEKQDEKFPAPQQRGERGNAGGFEPVVFCQRVESALPGVEFVLEAAGLVERVGELVPGGGVGGGVREGERGQLARFLTAGGVPWATAVAARAFSRLPMATARATCTWARAMGARTAAVESGAAACGAAQPTVASRQIRPASVARPMIQSRFQ